MATLTWMLSFEIQRCPKQIPPVPVGRGDEEENGATAVALSDSFLPQLLGC